MNLTSKQRAYLRKIAVNEDTITQLGKDGITDSFVNSLELAIAKREIVKFRVLENSMLTAREAAELTAQRINAQVVTVIGSKAVLYRQSEDNVLGL